MQPWRPTCRRLQRQCRDPGHELTKFALYLGASPERPQVLTYDVLDLLGADSGEAT
jgi:hypothetical protein